jgi:hypothetical protein
VAPFELAVLRVVLLAAALLVALLGVVLLLAALLGVVLLVVLLGVVLLVVFQGVVLQAVALAALGVQLVVPRAAALLLMAPVLLLGTVELRMGAIPVLPRLIEPGLLSMVLQQFLSE